MSAVASQGAVVPSKLDFSRLLSGEYGRVGSPIGYRLIMLPVVVIVLLLPLVYVAMIGAVVYGLWQWVQVVAEPPSTRGGFRLGLVWLAVLVGGIILLLSMLRPLVIWHKSPPREPLHRSEEPLLYAYVEAICTAMGAPKPKQIYVSCEPNAAAGFHKGIWGLLTNQLSLVVGLPLAASMPLRDFTGVLAHEFGHFAQGSGMRASYLLITVNSWFARVAYEPDAIDEALEQAGENVSGYLAIVIGLARLTAIIPKMILRGLCWVVGALTCILSRQMEFDADRHEARMAGTKSFRDSFERLFLLNHAYQPTIGRVTRELQQGRLPDDFPGLVAAHAEGIDDATRRGLIEEHEKTKTGLFDSHPCFTARMKAVTKLNEPGIFTTDEPASIVFHDFHSTCRRATYLFYKGGFGDKIQHATFTSGRDLATRIRGAQADAAVAAAFYGGGLTMQFAPPVGETVKAPRDPKAAAVELRAVRSDITAAMVDIGESMGRLEKLEDELRAVNAGLMLVDATIAFMPGKLKLRTANKEALLKQKAGIEGTLFPLRSRAESFANTQARRIMLALGFLYVSGAERSIRGIESRRERVKQLLVAATAIRAGLSKQREIKTIATSLEAAFRHGEKARSEKKVTDTIEGNLRLLRAYLSDLQGHLHGVPHPAGAGGHEDTLARAIMPRVPGDLEVGELVIMGTAAISDLQAVGRGVYCELAAIAAEIEQRLKVAPRPSAPEPAAA